MELHNCYIVIIHMRIKKKIERYGDKFVLGFP